MAGVLLMAGLSVAGAVSPSGVQAYCSAREFVSHFQALRRSSVPAGFWQKVTLSLVLAGASGQPECEGARQRTQSASL